MVLGLNRTKDGWLSLLEEASGNWEIAGSRVGKPGLQTLPLHSAELAAYVNNDELSPTSVFAFDLVMRWMNTTQLAQS